MRSSALHLRIHWIMPTHGDITADCVAKAFGVPINTDPRARVLGMFWGISAGGRWRITPHRVSLTDDSFRIDARRKPNARAALVSRPTQIAERAAPQPAPVEAPAPELIEPVTRPDLHDPVRSWDPPRVIQQ